jgi:ribose transport system ATP-binding protein
MLAMTTRAETADHKAPSAKALTLLAARHISKNFGGIAALTDAHFDLIQGEVHALVGENGAGKSILMKILSGVYSTYDGEISIECEPTRFSSVREAEAAGIAIIHQELNLVPELTVADNIFLGREPRIAGIFLDRKTQEDATRRLLARLGIDLDPNTRVSELRVGEQQLIEIAKALSLSARTLIIGMLTATYNFPLGLARLLPC